MRRFCPLTALWSLFVLMPSSNLWCASTREILRTTPDSIFTLQDSGGRRVLVDAFGPNADDPSGLSGSGLPDLVFYAPYGLDHPTILTTNASGYANDPEIFDTQTIYLGFGLTNTGSSYVRSSFICNIYVDDLLFEVLNVTYSFNPSYFVWVGAVTLGKLEAGDHTLRIVLDVGDEIAESNEDNNTLVRRFEVLKTNRRPVVEAGSTQTVRTGSTVTLHGSATDDPDQSLTYTWSQLSGATVTLEDPHEPETTFTAPAEAGDLTFRLTVSDGSLSGTDTVRIIVDPNANTAPSAHADADRNGVSGQEMSVTGSGSDPDGDTLAFTWTQLDGTTGAPQIDLIDSDQATVRFTPPEWPHDYDIVLQLTVTDALGASNSDSVRIRIDAPDPHWVVVPYALGPTGETSAADIGQAGLLDGTFVGVVLANPNELAETSAELEARAADGTVVLHETQSIPAEGQISFLSTEATSASETASLMARGWAVPLQGFFLVGESALTRLDGVGGGLVEGTELKFLMASSFSGHETYVQIFNTGPEPAEDVVVALHRSDGALVSQRTITIPPEGAFRTSIEEFLESGDEIDEGYLEVSSTVALRGFEIVAEAETLSALTGQPSEPARELSAPHFFVAPNGGSMLRILNSDAESVTVDVAAYRDDGSEMAEASATIPAGQLMVADLAQLLSLNDLQETLTGYLVIRPRLLESEEGRNLLGALTFHGAGYESTLPLVREGRTQTLFLHVAQSEALRIFTGLALQNPNPEETEVTVEVYSSEGTLTASRTLLLPPGARVVDLLNGTQFMGPEFEQVNGHIKVKSTLPILSFALFGASDLAYMSAIEGQAPLLETGVFEVTGNSCGNNAAPELISITPDPRAGLPRFRTGRWAEFNVRFRDDSELTIAGNTHKGLSTVVADLEELTSLGIEATLQFPEESDPYASSLRIGFEVPDLDANEEVILSVTATDVQGCATTVRFSLVLEK